MVKYFYLIGIGFIFSNDQFKTGAGYRLKIIPAEKIKN